MPDGGAPRAGVLIASHRRPADLLRCLRGLEAQSRPADEIVVVLREDDTEGDRHLPGLAATLPALRVVRVRQPGVVAARNAGLDRLRTDIVAVLDDDTVPRPDWLARVVAHFAADPDLGGLGGRDRCHDGTGFDDRQAAPVGRLTWYGRPIGNHHLGHGPAREVEFLKGANMSFRRAAIAGLRFDMRLRGEGAGPHEDFAFSLAVRRRGWRLLYDPAVLVEHYPGRRDEPRYYAGVRQRVEADGFRNHAYNLVLAMWDSLPPWRRLALAAWLALAGTATCPGLLQAARLTPALRGDAWRRCLLAQQGAFAAYRTLLAAGAAGAAPACLPREG